MVTEPVEVMPTLRVALQYRSTSQFELFEFQVIAPVDAKSDSPFFRAVFFSRRYPIEMLIVGMLK
jgi:hypothetical protein